MSHLSIVLEVYANSLGGYFSHVWHMIFQCLAFQDLTYQNQKLIKIDWIFMHLSKK